MGRRSYWDSGDTPLGRARRGSAPWAGWMGAGRGGRIYDSFPREYHGHSARSIGKNPQSHSSRRTTGGLCSLLLSAACRVWCYPRKNEVEEPHPRKPADRPRACGFSKPVSGVSACISSDCRIILRVARESRPARVKCGVAACYNDGSPKRSAAASKASARP